MKKHLDQFMWGYQEHFQFNIEYLIRHVLQSIGFEGVANVLLVGLADPDVKVEHPVCLCPEDGRWTQQQFSSLPEKAAQAEREHPLQRMIYGDEPSMRDKPENIRRRAISEEVGRQLRSDDERHGVKSFCSTSIRYENYYVTVVVQVSIASLGVHPLIRYQGFNGHVETNLVKLCIYEVLDQASDELLQPLPEPGRSLRSDGRLTAGEIVARAAQSLMRIPFIAGDWANPGLFGLIEEIAKLLYEQRVGRGAIILAAKDDPNVDYVLHLRTTVQLSQARWVRKLIEMATGKNSLIAGYDRVYGLGSISDVSAPPFAIDIVGPHQWDLRQGDQTYLQVRRGVAQLPQEAMAAHRFDDNVQRILGPISEPAVARMRNILKLLVQLQHGSMIIFAKDAATEAERLEGQGTLIQPTPITRELLKRATAIDGTILVDPDGVCHAIGVILDGLANPDCTPSRGSRYNSAVRYVGDGSTGRLALVVSDDATLDVVPLLRIRVDKNRLDEAVTRIEKANQDTYHEARNILDEHRFYLDENQCKRINIALDRIESEPREVGRLMFVTERFVPDLAMNESYLLPEEGSR